jgi:Zn-dependent peptidase ImmA (M78 family)
MREYPVKLGALAKSLGITVLLSTLPRGISGKISYENGAFVIRVNRHEAKHRQRFTLAHEIAHFLLHRDMIMVSGGWTENALLRSGQPASIEYEANRLASDLVIPSKLLVEETSQLHSAPSSEIVEELAKKFGVSVAAMEIKLQMS